MQGDAILEGATWKFAAGTNRRGPLVSRQGLSTEDDGDPFNVVIYTPGTAASVVERLVTILAGS